MTLDELFNNAKNGTQDAGYEEGHVSHRKNGDFIKQGGTWVPMKGQKQEGAEKTEAGADEQTMRQSLINFMTKGAPHTTEADAKKAVENLDPETLNQMFEGLKEQHGDKFLAKQEEAAPDYDKEKMDREDEKHEAARKDAEERNASEGQPNTTQSSAAELKLWEKSAKTDAKLSGENQVIFQDANGNCVMYAEGDSDGEAKAEAHGYKKMSLVRPDGSVKRHQGNNPEPTLASTFEAAKNNGWEETQMASGKLWDSPDGKQRIVERKDPESGESKYVLRPKSASDPAPDKSFNSLEEAFEAAKNGGEAPARKAVDNTTGSNFKKGQRVPNAGAIGQTYRHRERQYLAAHQKEADANPKEVTERRDVLASLVANSREQAQMYEAINGRSEGEGNEWEINSHTAEELNRLLKEEKQLQGKLKKLDKAPAAGPKKNDLAAEQTARNEAMKAAENESQNAAVFNDLNEKAATEGIEYKIRKTKAGEYYWDKYRDGKHVGGGTARDKTDAINRANKNFDEYIKENKKSAGSIDAAPLIEAQSVNAPGDSFKKKLTGDCKVKLSKIKR